MRFSWQMFAANRVRVFCVFSNAEIIDIALIVLASYCAIPATFAISARNSHREGISDDDSEKKQLKNSRGLKNIFFKFLKNLT